MIKTTWICSSHPGKICGKKAVQTWGDHIIKSKLNSDGSWKICNDCPNRVDGKIKCHADLIIETTATDRVFRINGITEDWKELDFDKM